MNRKNYLLPITVLLVLATYGCVKSDLGTIKKAAIVNPNRDTDGNVYHTVTIGTQTWMVENFKATHYSNGDPIPYSSAEFVTGAYCNYNDKDSLGAIYGRLYNYAVIKDPRNIAPPGWHLPSDAEWSTLEAAVGGPNVAGGALKEAGNLHWNSPNTDATNSSGFTALGGGNNGSGQFADLGNYTYFWADASSVYSRALIYNIGGSSGVSNQEPNQFFSIRLIKDN